MRTQDTQQGTKQPSDQWKKFGEWLRAVRQQRDISGRELARRAGIAYSTLRMLEDGGRMVYDAWRDPNPEPYTLHRIADALGVDAAELFAQAGRRLNGTAEVPTSTTDLERRVLDAMGLLGEVLAEVRRSR